jgi:hypothetical protein
MHQPLLDVTDGVAGVQVLQFDFAQQRAACPEIDAELREENELCARPATARKVQGFNNTGSAPTTPILPRGR